MAKFGGFTGEERLRQSLANLAELADNPRAKTKALMAGGFVLERAGKQNIRDALGQQSGDLRASWVADLDPFDREAIFVGTDKIYARIHEFGGTIKAKRGKYLAIPVGDLKGSPRKYDLAFVPSKRGGGVLIDDGGEVQYVLKESVYIPPRPYARPAVDENKQQVAQEIGRAWGRMVEMEAR